ncbi:MAG: AmmeMemoRadiSam system protein B [archaeon]|nr:MAG: AmmeMemoRadiSam system protein B [archaeon]
MIRKPVVAGQFYESDPEKLKQQIRGCFLHRFGPGKLPLHESSNKRLGLVVPHAGYLFSGPCAAHAYSEFVKHKVNTVILLGPNHSGISKTFFSVSFKDFQTPLGVVRNNKALGRKIVQETEADQDEDAHENEHSLEVQLPFLQFISQDFNIVPILISSPTYERCKEFALKLAELVDENTAIIASSDFTHYGPNYGFLPFNFDMNGKKKLYDLDKSIIGEILRLNDKRFFDKASKSTVCGLFPILTVMEFCNKLKVENVKLLKYYTSSDIQEANNSVGYASIMFN